MSMGFSKWWPCPKKHLKRTEFWLKRARELKKSLGDKRDFRYFTLCALPMIDVFLLAKEKILSRDEKTGRFDSLAICEYEPVHVPILKELIGNEAAVFEGSLEDMVLFEDTSFTQQFPDLDSIERYKTEKGLKIPETRRALLDRKTRHLQFQTIFPFDFLNLDFCEYYYPKPPD